ncbi:MAG: hypothetical protein ABSF10_20365 [Verrucomicrobiota bacterium]|jgi:hypothetical protein
MKIILVLIIVAACAASAQPVSSAQPKGWCPKDPVREIDGSIVSATTMSEFYGVVLEVQPTGIRVQGEYGDCKESYSSEKFSGFKAGEGDEFFVAHFPYDVAVGDRVGRECVQIGNTFSPGSYMAALETGTYTYSTVLGGSRTIHKLEYGTPYTSPPPPPPTPEQIAAAKAKVVADKKANEEKGLKYNQELAAKGDSYGLLRMGERYRDGDGVPKDLAKARDYFTKAVAAGSPSAADALSGLDQSTNAATTKQ